MKKTIQLGAILICLLMASHRGEAQLWKKIKDKVKNTAENNIVERAGNATDKTIDNAADGAKKSNSNTNTQASNVSNETVSTAAKRTTTNYTNYDFVPGDKIIFEPDLSKETDAELPARFTVEKGNAEIQTFEGEKIMHLGKDGKVVLSPLMNSDSYLPEQFTVEFDMMMDDDGSNNYPDVISLQLREAGDKSFTSSPACEFTILRNSSAMLGYYQSAGTQELPSQLSASLNVPNTWHHVAVYIHKNIGKAYVDGYRVCATNKFPSGFSKMDLYKVERYGYKIKNFRLAEGGSDAYDKLVTDGKIITHGILFDVNKSSIKPESSGTLNEVAKLLKSHTDLRLEIDGYTDNDGDANANLQLSQSRANAVKAALIKMGIDASRLTAKGFGETKPVDSNDNAEGKANNRRVEFVKI